MTTATGQRRRSGRLRRAAALVKVPRVVFAAVVWLVLIEALPGVAGWGVLVVVGGTLAAVLADLEQLALVATPTHEQKGLMR